MENTSDELKLNGVVYNEMKGAFSSPDDVLDREIVRNLFPDTVYANESGGDPDVIPNLTYEQFLDFHRKYYHPVNSYIYLYGNMDMVERLNWMDEHYLSHFEKIDVEANISLQEPFAAPREAVKPYSITESEPLEHNTYLTCSMTAGGRFKPGRIHCLSDSGLRALFLPGCALKAGTFGCRHRRRHLQ